MFQTVPDRSSYVKVRHDSEFNKVMTRRSLPPTPTPIPSLVGGGGRVGGGPRSQRVDLELRCPRSKEGGAHPPESLVEQ